MAAVESSAVFELRPMNLADMLDAVIRLFRHNFGILVRIAAVIHVPLGVIYIASMAAAVGGIDTEEPPTDLPWATMIGGAGVILYVILMMLAMPIMQGAMAKALPWITTVTFSPSARYRAISGRSVSSLK